MAEELQLSIPSGFAKRETTFDLNHNRVELTVYENTDEEILLHIKDHVTDEVSLHGPFNMRQVKSIQHVIGDVLWRKKIT